MFVTEYTKRTYYVPDPQPTPFPNRPGSRECSICCGVIMILGLVALGIVNVQVGTSSNKPWQTAIGSAFIAVGGCCLVCLVAVAIQECLKKRRERSAQTRSDYIASDAD